MNEAQEKELQNYAFKLAKSSLDVAEQCHEKNSADDYDLGYIQAAAKIGMLIAPLGHQRAPLDVDVIVKTVEDQIKYQEGSNAFLSEAVAELKRIAAID